MNTLYAIRSISDIDALIIAADKKWQPYTEDIVKKVFANKAEAEIVFLGFCEPGITRQGSIVNALHALKPYMTSESIVMIHDAVRPNVSKELIKRCLDVMKKGKQEYDGVMPYIRIKDTIYESDDGISISSLTDRDKLYAGQTPEFFNCFKYLEANEALSEEELNKINGSSEAAVMAGMKIALIEGEESNFKITTSEDLERFKRKL